MGYASSFAAKAAYRPTIKTSEAWILAVAQEAMKSKMARERDWDFPELIADIREDIQKQLCPPSGREALNPTSERKYDPRYLQWAEAAAESMVESREVRLAEPRVGEFTACELIELEARRYECWTNGLGDLLAITLRHLASQVAVTRSIDPAAMAERLEILS